MGIEGSSAHQGFYHSQREAFSLTSVSDIEQIPTETTEALPPNIPQDVPFEITEKIDTPISPYGAIGPFVAIPSLAGGLAVMANSWRTTRPIMSKILKTASHLLLGFSVITALVKEVGLATIVPKSAYLALETASTFLGVPPGFIGLGIVGASYIFGRFLKPVLGKWMRKKDEQTITSIPLEKVKL